MSDEDLLRPPAREMKPYPPKYITLVTGEKMVIRQATWEEIPIVMDVIYPLIKVNRDYYDIVGARAYAELLSMLKHRVRDEYLLVGLLDGELVGMVNGRLCKDIKTGMSYHTMAFKRGIRSGAHLFAAKMEYHFLLGNEEVLIVAESPIGFRRWMEELRLEPDELDREHELGGVDTWVLTRKIWDEHVVPNRLFGERPVPDELLEKNKVIRKPTDVVAQVTGKVK